MPNAFPPPVRIQPMLRLSFVLLITAALSLQAQKQPAGAGRLVGETAAGFIGTPLGFAGALLGPALGVNAVGNGGPSRGNFAATVGGAAVGYGVTYLAVPIAAKVSPTKLKIAAIAAAFALPAIGATIAYNATRK